MCWCVADVSVSNEGHGVWQMCLSPMKVMVCWCVADVSVSNEGHGVLVCGRCVCLQWRTCCVDMKLLSYDASIGGGHLLARSSLIWH